MQTHLVPMSRHQLFVHMAPSVDLFDQPCNLDNQNKYRVGSQFSPFGSFLTNYQDDMEFFTPGIILQLYPEVLHQFPCLAQYLYIVEKLESLTQNHDFWLHKKQNLKYFYKQHIII